MSECTVYSAIAAAAAAAT